MLLLLLVVVVVVMVVVVVVAGKGNVEFPLVSVDARRVLLERDNDGGGGDVDDADALGAPNGTPGSAFMLSNTFSELERAYAPPPRACARPRDVGSFFLFLFLFFFFFCFCFWFTKTSREQETRTSQVPIATQNSEKPKRKLNQKQAYEILSGPASRKTHDSTYKEAPHLLIIPSVMPRCRHSCARFPNNDGSSQVSKHDDPLGQPHTRF